MKKYIHKRPVVWADEQKMAFFPSKWRTNKQVAGDCALARWYILFKHCIGQSLRLREWVLRVTSFFSPSPRQNGCQGVFVESAGKCFCKLSYKPLFWVISVNIEICKIIQRYCTPDPVTRVSDMKIPNGYPGSLGCIGDKNQPSVIGSIIYIPL